MMPPLNAKQKAAKKREREREENLFHKTSLNKKSKSCKRQKR